MRPWSRLRRQLLEVAGVVHLGADGKAVDPAVAGARPTLWFRTLRGVHEGPPTPDKAGRVGPAGCAALARSVALLRPDLVRAGPGEDPDVRLVAVLVRGLAGRA